MINDYTEYVIAKRRNALTATVFFSLIPILSVISFITLNLITLHRGIRAGGEVLLALTGANIAVMFIGYTLGLNTDLLSNLEMIIYFNFCSYAAAILLREYKSWFLTIECVCYVGLLIILYSHFMYPDLSDYWLNILNEQAKSIGSMFSNNPAAPDLEQLKDYARRASGIQSLLIIMHILLYLVTARWMQTRRFKPGLLRQELHLLRADYVSLVIVGCVVIGAYFDIPTARDMHIIAILPMVLTGLSIVHNFTSTRTHWFLLLMSFYLVFSLFSAFTTGLLIVLAILDLFFDIRGKYNGYHTARTHSNR